MSWDQGFHDPIPLPRGRLLITLEDAAGYIMKQAKAEQDLPEWQAATRAKAERSGADKICRPQGKSFYVGVHCRYHRVRFDTRNKYSRAVQVWHER